MLEINAIRWLLLLLCVNYTYQSHVQRAVYTDTHSLFAVNDECLIHYSPHRRYVFKVEERSPDAYSTSGNYECGVRMRRKSIRHPRAVHLDCGSRPGTAAEIMSSELAVHCLVSDC